MFRDTFAEPPRAEPPFGAAAMSFHQVGGAGVLTSRSAGILPAIYRDFKQTDAIEEFERNVVPATTSGGQGVPFRTEAVDAELPNYYAMPVHPSIPQVVFYRWQRTQWTLNATYSFKTELWSTDQVNLVRLEFVGGRFRVFVNGEFVAEQSDEQLKGPGHLGLCSAPGPLLPEAAHFRNLSVYKPGQP